MDMCAINVGHQTASQLPKFIFMKIGGFVFKLQIEYQYNKATEVCEIKKSFSLPLFVNGNPNLQESCDSLE